MAATVVVTATAAVYVLVGTAPVAALQVREGQQARVVIAASLPAANVDTYFTLKHGDRLTALPILTDENVYLRAEIGITKVAVIEG